MNIVLLAPAIFAQEGGIERLMRLYLKSLCESCRDNEHVYSLALNDSPSPPDSLSAYSNNRLASYNGFNHDKLRFTVQALRLARHADLVICGHIHQLVIARLAQIISPKLRYYLIAHGIDVWRKYTTIERWSLRGADKIFCVSQYTRKQMLRFYSALKPARLEVVSNALDPRLGSVLSTESSRRSARITQSPPSNPIILSVGRLKLDDLYKGFDKLIEAMPQVSREYPDAQLRIVGTGDALPYLQAIARSLGVDRFVSFVGRLTDEELMREYEACTLFALPSRKEGFGLVYLEAMAYGKPCICANAGGAPEVVAVPDTGLAVEYGNISELAEAIIEILRHPRDPEIIRKHAQQFSYERFRDRLAELIP
ncbi:glycosyltransferase family 4 protein [Cephaloticoccus primus]|uniref:glycosyltransferase family 4 protein n=1 Tax=Cephaloticoccus primus TaxID=1548207 RepID=UPI0009ED9900|nr:glycosyltransferase family 4 protein [Cephaloticoccus primus]